MICRTARAFDTMRICKRQPQAIDNFSALANHPVLTKAPTETYENPLQNGGWLYVITPLLGSWIGFVDIFGGGLLWLNREADGGVIGDPIAFRRPDLNLIGRLLKKVL